MAFSPDGTRLASASSDRSVRLWDAATGAAVATLAGHTDAVISVAYSPDGKHVLSGSDDTTVKIWDSTTGKEVSVLLCDRPIVCCCLECADVRGWSMSRSAR